MAKSKAGADKGVNMQDLARVGARARLESLRAEQAALLAAFPDLRGSSAGPARSPQARASRSAVSAQRSGGRKGAMSAAQRKAVGERMRAYWAARRAEKAGGTTAQAAADGGGGTKSAGKTKGKKASRRK